MQKWYLLGAPRAEKLFGEALLYEEGRVVHKTFKGDQRGSYFGSSVLSIDADNDGVDDVLVGAPTYFSQEYDEGCVYYYRNNGEVSYLCFILNNCAIASIVCALCRNGTCRPTPVVVHCVYLLWLNISYQMTNRKYYNMYTYSSN